MLLGAGTKIQVQEFTKIAKEIMVKDTIPEMTLAIITEDSIAIKKVLGHHKITEIKDKRMKNFYYEQEINVPVDSIDVYKWLRELTDIEYQSFSKGHKAMGHLNEGEFGGMINVEIVGGLLLVQHYSIKDKSKSHVYSYSDQSRAYLMGIIPIKVEVSWSLSVLAVSNQKSKFVCEVGVLIPSKILSFISSPVISFSLKRHLKEEGALFAKDIEKKFR